MAILAKRATLLALSSALTPQPSIGDFGRLSPNFSPNVAVKRDEDEALELSFRTLKTVVKVLDRDRIRSLFLAGFGSRLTAASGLVLIQQSQLHPKVKSQVMGQRGPSAGLSALHSAMERLEVHPDEYVLINCTELGLNPESNVGELPGGASASLVLGHLPEGEGVQFVDTRQVQLETNLTQDVPSAVPIESPLGSMLVKNGLLFLESLLADEGLSVNQVNYWAIHSSLADCRDAFVQALSLGAAQMRATERVLKQNGDCCSVAVWLILEEILRNDRPKRGEYGILFTVNSDSLHLAASLVRF